MVILGLIISIVVSVVLFVSSYWKNWWKNKYLKKFYFFFGFDYYASRPEPETRHYYLVGAEQWVHFSIGIFVGLMCRSFLPTWLSALMVGIIKELIDVVFSGTWHKKDSIVDVLFHTLGGLSAPFFLALINWSA